jgi:hypothetical protein
MLLDASGPQALCGSKCELHTKVMNGMITRRITKTQSTPTAYKFSTSAWLSLCTCCSRVSATSVLLAAASRNFVLSDLHQLLLQSKKQRNKSCAACL